MTKMSARTVPGWTVGDRLRKARELTGLSIQAFAVELGASRNTIAKYEQGHGAPGKTLMLAWAMRTGVPVEWLRDGDAHPTPDDGLSATNPCLSFVRHSTTPFASFASLLSVA